MQIDFSASVYSDPAMRSHLEKYYQQKYQPVYDRIEAMEAAEAAGAEPQTLRIAGSDEVAVEISAAQYRAAIPSFDKWLEIQTSWTESQARMFDESTIENAQQRLTFLEANDPDTSSGVQTVFADGDNILGYINQDGSVVTHSDGAALQRAADEAEALGLTGQDRIDYIRTRGEEALSARFGDLEVTDYTDADMPTKRAFAEQWYPEHDVDAAYRGSVESARAHVEWVRQQVDLIARNRNEMMNFLIESLQGVEGTAESLDAA